VFDFPVPGAHFMSKTFPGDSRNLDISSRRSLCLDFSTLVCSTSERDSSSISSWPESSSAIMIFLQMTVLVLRQALCNQTTDSAVEHNGTLWHRLMWTDAPHPSDNHSNATSRKNEQVYASIDIFPEEKAISKRESRFVPSDWSSPHFPRTHVQPP